MDKLSHVVLNSERLNFIASSTGQGKTLVLIEMAAIAYLNGKKVAYFNFEGLDTEFLNKQFALCLKNKTIQDYVREGDFIIINIMSNNGVNLQEIIRSKILQLKIEGFSPNFICVSGIDSVPSDRINENVEINAIMSKSSRLLLDLSKMLNCPVWATIQTYISISGDKDCVKHEHMYVANAILLLKRFREFGYTSIGQLSFMKARLSEERNDKIIIKFDEKGVLTEYNHKRHLIIEKCPKGQISDRNVFLNLINP